MALTRRSLLGSLLATAALPGAGARAASTEAKHLIVLLAPGGWDTAYALDPRVHDPDVDTAVLDQDSGDLDDREAIETFADIPVLVNDRKRPAVRSFFDRWAHDVAVVNGIWTGSLVHERCLDRLLCGTKDRGKPDLTLICGTERSPDRPLASLDLTNRGRPGTLGMGAGRLGSRQQLAMLLDPERDQAGLPEVLHPPGEADLAAIRDLVGRRTDRWAQRTGAVSEAAAMHEATDRAQRLVADGAAFADTLSLGVRHDFESNLLHAVDAIETGICGGVLLDDQGQWDTHPSSLQQHTLYERLFSSLDALADDLLRRGMWQDTVVVVLSEMGRTPRRNADGGKDHWPHTSALLFGGPVVGGRTRGATAGPMVSQPVDLETGVPDPSGELLRYDRFAAGVLELVGVDPGRWLGDVTPFRGVAV